MPSIFSRKPWTKCCRACSPSVTISRPASSCSLTASRVASRLARDNSEPVDFQGAHSVLGWASHSGFGREPAIVVGNSMGASRSVLIERLSAMSYAGGTEQQKSSRRSYRSRNNCPSFRDAPLGAGPESILTIVVMDSLMCNCTSKLALRAPRNDEINWEETKQRKRRQNRILLRLLQSLNLSRLPHHPAAGEAVRCRDFVAADPGRRHLQYHQPHRL